ASLFDKGELEGLRNRVEFLRAYPEGGDFPQLTDGEILERLARVCAGMLSVREIRSAQPRFLLQGLLSAEQSERLDRMAPRSVSLPGRRHVAVHYESGKLPWIESRLQDFFGMREGPRILGGRAPVTLHLLAPNHRAVQVTSDLAG